MTCFYQDILIYQYRHKVRQGSEANLQTHRNLMGEKRIINQSRKDAIIIKAPGKTGYSFFTK